MKHIVMLSGGMGSAITAKMVVEDVGATNVILLFADVLAEDADLYRFNREFSQYVGIPITTICEGRTPWQTQVDAKYGTNSRVDPCSRMLKREFMDAWVEGNFKPWECICYVGIDATESHRIERLEIGKLPWVYRAPMVERGLMLTDAHKVATCRSWGIEPPRLYLMGFKHNNCGGACPKAGLAQWKLLWETMPERYLGHEYQQRQLLKAVPNARPFLRKIEGKVKRYLWLWEYREEYLEGGKPLSPMDAYDWGGCGCAVDLELDA